MSFLSPVRRKVLAALPADMQAELAVWSRHHANLFDVRFHSIRTCPYLAYFPAYLFLRHDTLRWSLWLHRFYGHKHKEEGRCPCEAELAGCKPPPAGRSGA